MMRLPTPSVFVALALWAFPAHAFVDPGTGSLMLQALLAVGVGALFYVRRVRDFLKRLLRFNRGPDSRNDRGR